MNKVAVVLCLGMFISCSQYSESFIEKYVQDTEAIENESIVVFPQGKGFCFVQNDIIRQIIYPQYSSRYDDYYLFLLALLNGEVGLVYMEEKEITRYDIIPAVFRPFLIRIFLSSDTISSGRIYEFKKRLSEKEKLGIVKMMFDSGYVVLWSDHSAEFLFFKETEL